MKFDRKRHYSLRKYKSVGLASAIVGLSMLGTTGVLNEVPVIGDMFGVETAHAAAPGFTRPNADLLDTRREEHHPGYIYVANPNMDAGREYITDPGESGGDVWYTFRDRSTGRTEVQHLPYSGSRGTKQIGTKPTEEVTSEIDFKTKYVADKTKEKGSKNEVQQEGVKGSVITRTTYELNTSTGTLIPSKEQIRNEPTDKIVKVAAKDKVETLQRGRQTVENLN